MKTTCEPLFSNGTEFMQWQYRNCERCIKQSRYNEKKDSYPAFRCSIDRDISVQQVGLMEVNVKSYEATRQKDCPYIQTEPKSPKKRKIKNQLELEL
jgi:hypothetical protein